MLSKLSTVELRQLKDAVSHIVFERPDLTGLVQLEKDLDNKLKKNDNYAKGMALLEDAEKHSGLDSGYARACDYFFAVSSFDLVKPVYENGIISKFEPTGEKYTQLLLCFKWDWYLNGETFDPDKDCFARNFYKFLGNISAEDIEQTDPEQIRQNLLKAGLEEKKEMIGIYENYCSKSHQEDIERSKMWKRSV